MQWTEAPPRRTGKADFAFGGVEMKISDDGRQCMSELRSIGFTDDNLLSLRAQILELV